jgi:hypothetical protein
MSCFSGLMLLQAKEGSSVQSDRMDTMHVP